MPTPTETKDKSLLQSMTLIAADDKRLAKYCNFVTFAVVEDNVIMNFIAKDVGMPMKGEDGSLEEQGVLIERIIVDRKHAHRIADKLNEVLSRSINEK